MTKHCATLHKIKNTTNDSKINLHGYRASRLSLLLVFVHFPLPDYHIVQRLQTLLQPFTSYGASWLNVPQFQRSQRGFDGFATMRTYTTTVGGLRGATIVRGIFDTAIVAAITTVRC